MEFFFYLIFGLLAIICAASELSKGQKDKYTTIPAFEAFKNNYLLVYSLMMGKTPTLITHYRFGLLLLSHNAAFFAAFAISSCHIAPHVNTRAIVQM